MGHHFSFSADQVLGKRVNIFLWLVPIFVGSIVFLLSMVLFTSLAARKGASSPRAKESPIFSWTRRVVPYLQLIPVPKNLVVRWGGSVVQAELVRSGLNWDGRMYAALRWASLWMMLSLAILLGIAMDWNLVSQFLGLVLLLVSFFGPDIWLRWRRDRRCETIDLALPNFLDRLALSMEAGLGFEIAFRRTTTSFSGLLGIELRKFVRELDRGHTRIEALDHLVESNPSKDLAAFVAAVKQSDRLGTSLARTLRIQTQILRARRKRRAEEAGRRLPILIVFPLVFFFLPALLIIYLAPPILHLFLGR